MDCIVLVCCFCLLFFAVFSHSMYWLTNPKKLPQGTLHGDRSRLWPAEQGKYNKKIKSGSTPPPPPPAPPRPKKKQKRKRKLHIQSSLQGKTKHRTRTTKRTKRRRRSEGHHVTATKCLGATRVSVRLVSVQDSFGSSSQLIGASSEILGFPVRSPCCGPKGITSQKT